MTQIEQKAVEYQIRTHGPNVMGGASLLSEEEYMRFNMNLDFKNGYEQAKKDLLAIVKEYMEKSERYMQQSYEAGEQGGYTFWDGFHDCAESFLREIEDK